MITEVGAEQNTMTIIMMPSEFVEMARTIGARGGEKGEDVSKRASGEAPDARLRCASAGPRRGALSQATPFSFRNGPYFLSILGMCSVSQPTTKAGGIASDLRLAGMEFLLQIEAGCDELVVLRLMSLIGGIAIFDEIGFLGGEVLRDIGDQRVESLADLGAVAGANGVAERVDQPENFLVLGVMRADICSKLLFGPGDKRHVLHSLELFFGCSVAVAASSANKNWPRRRAFYEYAAQRLM